MACLFGHKWNGCKCIKCGKVRDEGHDLDLCKGVCRICGQKNWLPRHDWQGCKCARCGATRDEGHGWNGCKCKICGKTRDEGHRWNGCKCSRCGKWRNEKHAWDGCKCRLCGERRDEGHDWQDGKCRRCGMRQEDSWDFAVQQMNEGSYELAIHCFRRIEANPLFRRNCSKELKACVDKLFEQNRAAVAANDRAHFSTRCLGTTLDELDKFYGPDFGRHPRYDRLMEDVARAVIESLGKGDYTNAWGWLGVIEYKDAGKDPALLRAIYEAALALMDRGEYEEARSWLYKLPKGFERRDEKLEACNDLWQRDPRNPDFCPKGPDGQHQWEVTASVKTIDNELRKAGHGTKRCKYCGKQENFEYDYDADGY